MFLSLDAADIPRKYGELSGAAARWDPQRSQNPPLLVSRICSAPPNSDSLSKGSGL
jgi:hypothetical protein